jgi:hypothetical protein
LQRQCLGYVALRAKPERDEQRAQAFAAVALEAQRAVEVRLIELAALDQDLANAFANGCVQKVSSVGRRAKNGIES